MPETDPTLTDPVDENQPLDADDDEQILDPTDEPEDDAQDEPEEQAARGAEGDQASRQPSRGERRFQAQQAENKRLAEENARVTRELHDLRARVPQAPLEDPRAEQERLALMQPDERANYLVDKALREHDRKTQQLAVQLWDQGDKATFDAKCINDKLRAKLAPEIERRFNEARSRGQTVSRDILFTYLVGERALAGRGSVKEPARERQRRQAASPANGRGDVVAARRPAGKTLEDRLAEVEI
jgi:hypothetical protein